MCRTLMLVLRDTAARKVPAGLLLVMSVMTDNLPVRAHRRVLDERAIISWTVMWARAGLAVAHAAGLQRALVELAHLLGV